MDDKIVELIKAGDDEGLKLLEQQYSGMMHYIVGAILHDPEDEEECISDISMKVWHAINSYTPERGKFSTWLTTISRNTALNHLKRSSGDQIKLPDAAHPTPSPEEEICRRERAEELKTAIAALSWEEQHLFYRKYYYFQQTAQIAAELGMTERSVEGKLYRLRKKLQKKLGGDLA